MLIFSYPSVLTYVLGSQKNRLIETVLLSTHNIGFGLEIRKLFFWYAILTSPACRCLVLCVHLQSVIFLYNSHIAGCVISTIYHIISEQHRIYVTTTLIQCCFNIVCLVSTGIGVQISVCHQKFRLKCISLQC